MASGSTAALARQYFLVRYADDFVVVFEDHHDALRVQEVQPKRFSKFGLTLHPTKTRLVPFRASKDGSDDPPPGSFDFLGFTHYWGTSRYGSDWPMRKTAESRYNRAIKALNHWMRGARPSPVEAQLCGRSQRAYVSWDAFKRLVARYPLPCAAKRRGCRFVFCINHCLL